MLPAFRVPDAGDRFSSSTQDTDRRKAFPVRAGVRRSRGAFVLVQCQLHPDHPRAIGAHGGDRIGRGVRPVGRGVADDSGDRWPGRLGPTSSRPRGVRSRRRRPGSVVLDRSVCELAVHGRGSRPISGRANPFISHSHRRPRRDFGGVDPTRIGARGRAFESSRGSGQTPSPDRDRGRRVGPNGERTSEPSTLDSQADRRRNLRLDLGRAVRVGRQHACSAYRCGRHRSRATAVARVGISPFGGLRPDHRRGSGFREFPQGPNGHHEIDQARVADGCVVGPFAPVGSPGRSESVDDREIPSGGSHFATRHLGCQGAPAAPNEKHADTTGAGRTPDRLHDDQCGTSVLRSPRSTAERRVAGPVNERSNERRGQGGPRHARVDPGNVVRARPTDPSKPE